MQNLANGTKFGAKESYMQPLNFFVDQNQVNLYNYFEKLAVRNEKSKKKKMKLFFFDFFFLLCVCLCAFLFLGIGGG